LLVNEFHYKRQFDFDGFQAIGTSTKTGTVPHLGSVHENVPTSAELSGRDVALRPTDRGRTGKSFYFALEVGDC
jgi:hypothetical protein